MWMIFGDVTVGLLSGAGRQDVQAEDAQGSAPSEATCRWKAIDSPLPTKCINKTVPVSMVLLCSCHSSHTFVCSQVVRHIGH